MSTTELSDVFEFHIQPMDPSRRDDVQRALDSAVGEAARETPAVQSASAELQGTTASAGEAVVLLHVVLAKGCAENTARVFVETCLRSHLKKLGIVMSHVAQQNTSGDN